MKILYTYGVASFISIVAYSYFGWRHNRNKMRYMSEDDNDLIVHRAWIKAGKKEEER